MVIFDQLRVSDDGKTFYISAHVNQAAYYDSVYISKVMVCTDSEVLESNPMQQPSKYIYQRELKGNSTKVVNIALTQAVLDAAYIGHENDAYSETATKAFTLDNFSRNLFFVYIECEGTPAANTPCGLDNAVSLGVTFDYSVLYNAAMNYTRELVQACEIPRNFIDFILRLSALQMAIETGHYVQALDFWKLLIGQGNVVSLNGIKNCGCHG